MNIFKTPDMRWRTPDGKRHRRMMDIVRHLLECGVDRKVSVRFWSDRKMICKGTLARLDEDYGRYYSSRA